MVVLSLGSNLGDRKSYLIQAIEELKRVGVYDIENSSFYETIPIDCPEGSNNFINMVLFCQYDKSAQDLLVDIQQIESDFGRYRRVRNEPRNIDIDIILFNDIIVQEEGLIIPHPRMHKRKFVLGPLCELNGEIIHPSLKKSISQLYEELQG